MHTDFLTIRRVLGLSLAKRFLAANAAVILAVGTLAAGAEPAHHASAKSVPTKASPSAMVKSAKEAPRKNVQVGSASWYGKAFQGKPTASGESYDMYQYT